MNRKYLISALIFAFAFGYGFAVLSLLWQPFAWSMVWWNPIAGFIAYVGMDYFNGKPFQK